MADTPVSICRLLCLTGVALSLGGCTTLVRGSSDKFEVLTMPAGATVETDLETTKSVRARKSDAELQPDYLGCAPTPCSFKVSRRANFTVSITLEGYQTGMIPIESNMFWTSGGASALQPFLSTAAFSTYLTSGAVTSFSSFFGAFDAALVGGGLGFLFLGVDVASGSMLDLQPNPLAVRLVPEGEAIPEEFAGFGMLPMTEEELKALHAGDQVDACETDEGKADPACKPEQATLSNSW